MAADFFCKFCDRISGPKHTISKIKVWVGWIALLSKKNKKKKKKKKEYKI